MRHPRSPPSATARIPHELSRDIASGRYRLGDRVPSRNRIIPFVSGLPLQSSRRSVLGSTLAFLNSYGERKSPNRLKFNNLAGFSGGVRRVILQRDAGWGWSRNISFRWGSPMRTILEFLDMGSPKSHLSLYRPIPSKRTKSLAAWLVGKSTRELDFYLAAFSWVMRRFTLGMSSPYWPGGAVRTNCSR